MSLVERLSTVLGQLRCLGDETTWLKAAGTSQAQMQFVMWIGNKPGCRLQQIATGLGLTAPTVSVGIHRLEQAGLIQRTSDKRDQRAINLVLTPRGHELYTQAGNAREHSMKVLLERLRPSEQRQLVEILERCLSSAVSGPQLSPAEPVSVSHEVSITEDASQDTVLPEGPKQLALFGG